jgi:HK97 family phage major capsid protein
VTTRKLQDEAAQIATRLEELRAVDVEAGTEAAKQIEDEQNQIAGRAEAITAQLRARNEINEKIARMKSTVGECEPRGLVVPKREVAVVEPEWDAVRGMPERVAFRVGRMLRDIARGELRGDFTGTTEEPNSMGEKSPTYDGRGVELVAGDFYRGIMGMLTYSSVAWQVCSRMSVSSNRITIPYNDEEVEAQYYLENCEILPVEIGTRGVTINVEKIGARAQVSNELIADAVVSVAELVARKFAYAFAKKIDKSWLEGDSAAGVTGLLPQITKSVTVTDKITPEVMAALMAQVNPNAVNTAWIMSPAGIGMLTAAAAGGIGSDITQPQRLTVFGSPVYKCLSLPEGTLGVYGDFAQATTIVDRSNGLTINASRERAIEYDQTVFVGTQRFGIASTGPSFCVKLLGGTAAPLAGGVDAKSAPMATKSTK